MLCGPDALQVLVADAAASEGAASFRTGGDALAAPYDPRASLWQVGRGEVNVQAFNSFSLWQVGRGEVNVHVFNSLMNTNMNHVAPGVNAIVIHAGVMPLEPALS